MLFLVQISIVFISFHGILLILFPILFSVHFYVEFSPLLFVSLSCLLVFNLSPSFWFIFCIVLLSSCSLVVCFSSVIFILCFVENFSDLVWINLFDLTSSSQLVWWLAKPNLMTARRFALPPKETNCSRHLDKKKEKSFKTF